MPLIVELRVARSWPKRFRTDPATTRAFVADRGRADWLNRYQAIDQQLQLIKRIASCRT